VIFRNEKVTFIVVYILIIKLSNLRTKYKEIKF